MTALQRRARALENNFAYEQEFMFRAQARRNRLIGLWAAALMGRENAQTYASELMAADVTEPDGAFARLRRDLDTSGVVVLDEELRGRMTSMLKEIASEMYRGR
jgi:hypothetical protein